MNEIDVEKILKEILALDNKNVLIKNLWNDLCDEATWVNDVIYSPEDIDEVFSDRKPSELAPIIKEYEKDFDYFSISQEGKVISFCTLDDAVNIEDLSDYLKKKNKRLIVKYELKRIKGQ